METMTARSWWRWSGMALIVSLGLLPGRGWADVGARDAQSRADAGMDADTGGPDTGVDGGRDNGTTDATGGDADAAALGNGKPVPRNAPSFSLQELVNRARNNDDLLAQYDAERAKAKWREFRADWARAPRIRSRTTLAPVPARADPDNIQNNFEEIANLNIGPFVDQRLRVIVPLYSFGRISTLQELAGVNVELTKIERRKAQLEATSRTKRAYWALKLSRTFEPLLERGQQRLERILQKMKDERAFGTADFETKDFRKLQMFAAKLKGRMADIRKAESVSLSGLRLLADLEPNDIAVGKIPSSGSPAPLAGFSNYFGAAKRRRPLLDKVDKGLKARRLQLEAAKQKFFPDVFVAAGLGAGWSTERTALIKVCQRNGSKGRCRNDGTEAENLWSRPQRTRLNRFSLNVALGIRWRLDPLAQRARVGQKRAKIEKLRAQKRRALKKIRIDVRRAYDNAVNRREKVEAQKQRLDAARKWRNQAGLSLQAAGEDLSEIGSAVKPLKKFYRAQADYLRARFRYKVARAKLSSVVGVRFLRRVEPDSDENE